MGNRILVTARSFRKTEGLHKQILRDAGYEIIETTNEQPLSAAELAKLVADVDGVILGLDAMTAAVIDQAKQLRVISRYGVGVDTVDVAAATRRGIVVTTTPGANSIAVAELTMALMLALARSIPYHDRLVRQGKWTRVQGLELYGSTLGIVGLGRIGREVARRAAGLGLRILFYDPIPPTPDSLVDLKVEPCPLEALLSTSDVVSLHLPLDDSSRHMIDRQALERMKPGALLINTARGGLVDEQALYEALVQGKLAGAACDVFAKEPPGDSPLLTLDNFIATPHIGSTTLQTTLRMGLMAAQNTLAVLRGERPAGVVNPEVYQLLGQPAA